MNTVTVEAVVPQTEVTVNTQATEAVVAPVKRPVGRPVTMKTLKRVVLLNGVPVGRGRPSLEGKGSRTVVYIPVDETYDIARHGVGTRLNKNRKQFAVSIKRIDLKRWEKMAKTPVGA